MIQKTKIDEFIRPDLLSFGAYTAPVSAGSLTGNTEIPLTGVIKLDQNENVYGCSPKVITALAKYKGYHIYPDSEQTTLREQLSGYTGIAPECIVAANGSNQLLDIITRLFVGEGDNVINFVPTFDIYRFSTQICGGNIVEIPRDDKFAIDTGLFRRSIDAKTKLIFIANPNAPTGNLTPKKTILELLDTGIPIVVDEAYYEFSGVTALPLMKKYPNLMVVRTFSKWAGLAGLRVGYGLFNPVIADYLHRIRIPFNVNVAALVAVNESLQDIDYLLNRTKQIIAEKDRLFVELKKFKWLKPYPSRANFILCQVLNGKASEIHEILQNKGIMVRYFAKPRLENCIRISVGKPEHSDALIKVLREI